MQHHLKVESLHKRFTMHMLEGLGMTALEDVSFAVERGEFLGVIGRSGSGKSSLLRCLYRRYLPTSGRMLYASESGVVDLACAADREVLGLRGQEIGYVSQFLHAIPRMPARDVVAEPLILLGAPTEVAREEAGAMMGSLGLPRKLGDSFPATMSGGEQQRVNLARALLGRPRLLLLDEPTSALDPETRVLAVEAIKDLKSTGTTMIGVFHDAATLEALSDRVLALESGKVRWTGHAGDASGLFLRSA